ncbi:NAD(P)/FAD-dependent oxidoreductase [Rhodopila globiformis]|uniref:Pyridine nucleotide-disulfide oxidoreductase n=1 Tax=Rhodopila globiformis TaxID=1071 RepID=A0A2S6N4H6_RHOGL|nr:FAD-dependent oxidoreductase [Rhodopila globiformis]PPQ29497.1 pyridine nucleotide-disulfide oxidoreductase [Rhodopila globiformis]
MARIVVLGSGFAALTAIRTLRRQGVDAEIVVVSPRDTLTYLPSLIWVPPGLRSAADLTLPLAGFFARHRATWHQGTVQRVTDGGRRVITDTGEIGNDVLLVASGGRFLKRLPGIEHALVPCDGLPPALAIRDRLDAMAGGSIALGFASNPAEPGAVRGGPMFEFLFGLDTLLRRQKRRDSFELVFFNPSQQPGQRLGPRAVTGLLAEMRRCGIRTHLGHKLVRFEERQVVTEGGAFDADMILFLPGLTGPAWLEGSDLPRSPGGFVQADATCRVPGLERVWVAGDGGSYPGPDWMPKQAHQADLQAVTAARNIAAELAGRRATARFRSELICIVDTLDAGMMVFRNPWLNLTLPRLRALHWAKRGFERHYLREYRSAAG